MNKPTKIGLPQPPDRLAELQKTVEGLKADVARLRPSWWKQTLKGTGAAAVGAALGILVLSSQPGPVPPPEPTRFEYTIPSDPPVGVSVSREPTHSRDGAGADGPATGLGRDTEPGPHAPVPSTDGHPSPGSNLGHEAAIFLSGELARLFQELVAGEKGDRKHKGLFFCLSSVLEWQQIVADRRSTQSISDADFNAEINQRAAYCREMFPG